MQLVLYQGKRILMLFENVKSPIVDGRNVIWEGGSIQDGLFLLIDDSVSIGEEVTDELLVLDRKADFVKEPPPDPAELKKQLAQTNALILDFMESTLA